LSTSATDPCVRFVAASQAERYNNLGERQGLDPLIVVPPKPILSDSSTRPPSVLTFENRILLDKSWISFMGIFGEWKCGATHTALARFSLWTYEETGE
jgi:hypothetical protein